MNNVVPLITSDDIDFNLYMQESEHRVKVKPAANWRAELERMCDEPEKVTGAAMPWNRTHDHVRFRPGETSIWAGENGSGKSQILGLLAMAFGDQDERTCIASFEMKPKKTLGRMLRQAAMTENPTKEFAGRFVDWTQNRLWLYDHQGRVDPDRLYAVIRYCAEKLGITQMIIDSLMKCVRGEDDYNGQKDFVHMLTVLAADLNMHIHLVHHVRKGDDDRNQERPRGKDAIKGSGAITDQVDQVFVIWRNKAKERTIEQLRFQGMDVDPDTLKKPDCLILVEKNRHGEWEGRIPLWYLPNSLQYVGMPNGRPIAVARGLA